MDDLDQCLVCGDSAVFGLCSACFQIRQNIWLTSKPWTREDLDDWLQDKGLNPARHITSGLLGDRATFLHDAAGGAWEAFPSMFQPLTEYMP